MPRIAKVCLGSILKNSFGRNFRIKPNVEKFNLVIMAFYYLDTSKPKITMSAIHRKINIYCFWVKQCPRCKNENVSIKSFRPKRSVAKSIPGLQQMENTRACICQFGSPTLRNIAEKKSIHFMINYIL
jgi:hypothetical protein